VKEAFDEYIVHSGGEAEEFLKEYFNNSETLLIGAVGFDPRAPDVANKLSSAGSKLSAIFIKELRPLPQVKLESMANSNMQQISDLLGHQLKTLNISIFAEDGAAVGGIKVVEAAAKWDLSSFKDIVVDISAMSTGIYFPLIKFLRATLQNKYPSTSLHILVSSHPGTDYRIRSNYDDQARYMHGYGGRAKLVGRSDPIKLWLPQLVSGRKEVYERLHHFIAPSDVCPVVPFLGKNPRRAEELIFEYRDALLDEWETDLKNVVLADESDPLDIYRTIRRVDGVRRRLFCPLNATMTIITPMGSKLSSVGSMLAAMDSELPVAYVESAGYADDFKGIFGSNEQSTLVHVWVHGPVS